MIHDRKPHSTEIKKLSNDSGTWYRMVSRPSGAVAVFARTPDRPPASINEKAFLGESVSLDLSPPMLVPIIKCSTRPSTLFLNWKEPPAMDPYQELVEYLVEGSRYGELEDVESALAQHVQVDSKDGAGRTGV
jgi:hypothetical protein